MNQQLAEQHMQKNHALTQKLLNGLPSHRDLINMIKQQGLRMAS